MTISELMKVLADAHAGGLGEGVLSAAKASMPGVRKAGEIITGIRMTGPKGVSWPYDFGDETLSDLLMRHGESSGWTAPGFKGVEPVPGYRPDFKKTNKEYFGVKP